jgi:hypothetical protein
VPTLFIGLLLNFLLGIVGRQTQMLPATSYNALKTLVSRSKCNVREASLSRYRALLGCAPKVCWCIAIVLDWLERSVWSNSFVLITIRTLSVNAVL